MYVRLAAGSLFAGRFEIVRLLAEGGMGAVYEVEHRATKRRRALKIMHPQIATDARMRERFVQEAQVGALIRSEHVVEVIDAGIDDSTAMPWLLMELLEGETLERALQLRRFDANSFEPILAQLCHALGAAHARRLVHRDLKPENIFLATAHRDDAPQVVKILDFGIAKLVSEMQSRATAQIGTPLYMAPEQMTPGGVIAPATDVWALGLIAFRVITGRYYWLAGNVEGMNTAMIVNEVLHKALVPASVRAAELGASLPPMFDAWFARCIARDAGGRFADAHTAREAYRSIDARSARAQALPESPQPARTEPIVALVTPLNAPPVRNRNGSGLRPRRRTLLALLAVSAAALVVALVYAVLRITGDADRPASDDRGASVPKTTATAPPTASAPAAVKSVPTTKPLVPKVDDEPPPAPKGPSEWEKADPKPTVKSGPEPTTKSTPTVKSGPEPTTKSPAKAPPEFQKEK